MPDGSRRTDQSTETRDPVEFHWIGDIVRRNLDENTRGTVFTYGDREWDWTDFDARVRHAQTGIRSDLLKPGQRIAVLERNHPVHAEALFAAANMGLVCTFVDWRLKPEEIVFALNESEAQMLFVGHEFEELIDRVRMDLDSVVSTITVGGPEDEYEEWLETHETHEALLKQAREVAASAGRIDEPVLRTYSSLGKNGPSRGEYTHRQLLASCSELLRRKAIRREDVAVIDEPLTRHSVVVRVLATMTAGATTTLIREG
jgi:acyl-CoA synthetase (AMP-forming)/AMP-acid ligase II